MLTRYEYRNPDLLDIINDLFDRDYVAHLSRTKTSESIDIDDEGVVLQMDVPGVPREALTVEIEDRTLFINAKRGDKDLSRKFTIRKGYDPTRCEASLVNGVLTVKVAKEKVAAPSRVKVEVT